MDCDRQGEIVIVHQTHYVYEVAEHGIIADQIHRVSKPYFQWLTAQNMNTHTHTHTHTHTAAVSVSYLWLEDDVISNSTG